MPSAWPTIAPRTSALRISSRRSFGPMRPRQTSPRRSAPSRLPTCNRRRRLGRRRAQTARLETAVCLSNVGLVESLARVRDSFDRPLCIRYDEFAGWSSLVARRAHNPEVAGSNPAPATSNHICFLRLSESYSLSRFQFAPICVQNFQRLAQCRGDQFERMAFSNRRRRPSSGSVRAAC